MILLNQSIKDKLPRQMSIQKQRLDHLVLEKKLFDTRKEAQAAIMDGWVLVNDKKVTKPGTIVNIEDSITLKTGFKKKKYVSRGGLKLEKALAEFKLNVEDRICIDLGASTGGFTDCLLKHGASKVYAVDVGYGQIDWSLRCDERVVLKERQNARYLTAEILYGEDASCQWADFACLDCSFISLAKIIPILPGVLIGESFQAVCLVKPQFEAGRSQVKKGVVKDRKIHKSVLETFAGQAGEFKLNITKVTYSPVKGPKGNIEFLVLIEPTGDPVESFDDIVEEAFERLSKQDN